MSMPDFITEAMRHGEPMNQEEKGIQHFKIAVYIISAVIGYGLLLSIVLELYGIGQLLRSMVPLR